MTGTIAVIDVETVTMIAEEIRMKKTVGVKEDRGEGMPCLTCIITHLTYNSDGSDINSTYRQYLVSMRNSSTYFTALTLFVVLIPCLSTGK
jgi:hypothetical protein